MSFLRQRAHRVRHQDSTAAGVPEPVTEHDPLAGAPHPVEPTTAAGPGPDVTEVATPNPTGPNPTAVDPTAPNPTAPNPTAPNPTAPNPTAPNPTGPNSIAVEPDPAGVPEQQPGSAPAAPHPRVARTRISGVWVAAVVAVVSLIFLLIFILQNLARVRVSFLGASGTLPMGVAMLFAAVGGALLIALFGSARVLQLRRTVRRRRSQER